MRAADIPYEVGDRVRSTDRGFEDELGTVHEIPDGDVVETVTVVTDCDEAYGEYAPEQWEPVK